MLLVRWGRLGRIIFLEAPVACDLKAFPRSRGLDPQRGTLETVVVQFPESTNESGRGDRAAEASSCLGPSGPSVSSSGSEFPKHLPPPAPRSVTRCDVHGPDSVPRTARCLLLPHPGSQWTRTWPGQAASS